MPSSSDYKSLKVVMIASFLCLSTIRALQISKTLVTNSARRQIHFANALKPERAFNQQSRNYRLLAKASGSESRSSDRTNSTIYLSTAAASIAGVGLFENDTTACAADIFPEEALNYDTYSGVTIDLNILITDGEKLDAAAFASKLQDSLSLWKEEGKRGIWLNIPTSCSDVVPHCTELGFEFQFAKKGLLVMTQWLPEDSHSRLPHGPTHQVGIGAVILHPVTGQMLVVQEKNGPAAAKKLWKIPTGLTDPGEDIVAAAIREAKEETGLDVSFDRIICMRQSHRAVSDMFFVCLLHLAPKYKEGLEKGVEVPLVPQEEEIAEIAWMSLDDFAAQDVWQGSPLYEELNGAMRRVANSVFNESKKEAAKGSHNTDENGCADAKEDSSHCGLVAKTLPVGWYPGNQTIYVSRL